jgi:hypothetical protein
LFHLEDAGRSLIRAGGPASAVDRFSVSAEATVSRVSMNAAHARPEDYIQRGTLPRAVLAQQPDCNSVLTHCWVLVQMRLRADL